jgi:hypothetical protein
LIFNIVSSTHKLIDSKDSIFSNLDDNNNYDNDNDNNNDNEKGGDNNNKNNSDINNDNKENNNSLDNSNNEINGIDNDNDFEKNIHNHPNKFYKLFKVYFTSIFSESFSDLNKDNDKCIIFNYSLYKI